MSYISPEWEASFKVLENIDLDRFWEHPIIKRTITQVSDIYANAARNIENSSDAYIDPLLKTLNQLISETDWQNLHNSLWRYIYYGLIIRNTFGNMDGKRILEVGSGYGGLCKVLTIMYNPAVYAVVDDPRMLRILSHFLRSGRLPLMYDANHLERVFSSYASYPYYDLFIATICLSETTTAFIQYLKEHVFPRCSQFFIINADIPTGLVRDIRNTLEALNKEVSVTDYINYKDVYMLTGKAK